MTQRGALLWYTHIVPNAVCLHCPMVFSYGWLAIRWDTPLVWHGTMLWYMCFYTLVHVPHSTQSSMLLTLGFSSVCDKDFLQYRWLRTAFVLQIQPSGVCTLWKWSFHCIPDCFLFFHDERFAANHKIMPGWRVTLYLAMMAALQSTWDLMLSSLIFSVFVWPRTHCNWQGKRRIFNNLAVRRQGISSEDLLGTRPFIAISTAIKIWNHRGISQFIALDAFH